MDIVINEETLSETTKCEKDYSCTKGKWGELCNVEDCVNGKVHFIKCANEEYCSYQHSFGYEPTCSCPTRQEIYNKYNV